MSPPLITSGPNTSLNCSKVFGFSMCAYPLLHSVPNLLAKRSTYALADVHGAFPSIENCELNREQ